VKSFFVAKVATFRITLIFNPSVKYNWNWNSVQCNSRASTVNRHRRCFVSKPNFAILLQSNTTSARHSYGKSVRPSVRHTLEIVSKWTHLSANFFHHLIWTSPLVFLSAIAVTTFRRELLSRSVNYTWVGKLYIFDRNRRLTRNY